MAIEQLRKDAAAKHQILRITFYPDVDSVPDIDKLSDVDGLADVEFIPIDKSNPGKSSKFGWRERPLGTKRCVIRTMRS